MTDTVDRTGIHVGDVRDFDGDQRKMIRVGGREIVVLRYGDRFHAFENLCLHMGGPVAEGVLIPRVEAVIDAEGQQLGERFNDAEMHIVCPWHGWEYDLETGEFMGNRRMKLRKFSVELRGTDVYVVV